MAYFLFIDESGQDRRESPYEVLAGVAVQDAKLWPLIQAIQQSEVDYFGIRYSAGERELKGKKILKKKVFTHAAQLPPIPPDERRELAQRCLTNGGAAGKREMTALAQAKIAYVCNVFELCREYECRIFASIVNDRGVNQHDTDYLRKDYSYLFERFFYYLEDVGGAASGIVVFDELEKSQSHLLLGQMHRYFKSTTKGRQRAGQIIPEPFFVHSDLTTGIQIADLAAYIISWGFRTAKMTAPAREELHELAEIISRLRHSTRRHVGGRVDFRVWSFGFIEDLRGGRGRGV